MTELREVKPGVRSGIMRRRERERPERREVEIVVSDGTPAGNLAAAQSKVAVATAAWQRAVDRARALERPVAVSDSEARTLGLESIYSLDGQGRRIIDRVEVEVIQARTRQEREEAALVLSAARDRAAALGLEAANVALADAVRAYGPIAAEVEGRRVLVERALVELVVQAWELNDSLDREKRAKGRVLKIAKQAAPSDDVRGRIDVDAPDSLPADMTSTGPSRTIRRAGLLLFGGADPRKPSTWTGLAELIPTGRKRGREVGKKLRAALDEAEQRIGATDPASPTPPPKEASGR